MHPKVLPPLAWKTVRALVAHGALDGWVLAGGTGLALQLGHRVSEDLDFFTEESFDAGLLLQELASVGPVAVQDRSASTLHVTVARVRISFLRSEAPLLFAGTPYRGLTLADPRDIAVMKLVAIGGRGSRKDFVDLYVYLRGGGDLAGLFQLLQRRFAGIDYNEYHLLKSLVFFDDAEQEPMPRMLRRLSWEEVKATLATEVQRLGDFTGGAG